MIKLFISSFYNTLIDEEDAIPTSTMFSIDHLKQKKVQFAITTNRLQNEVLYYNQDYPFIDYIISLNGSLIYDVNHEKTIELKSFTQKELEMISQEFVEKEIWYYTKDDIWNIIPQEAVYKLEIKGLKEWKNTKYHTSLLKRNQESFLEIGKNTPYDAIKKLKVKEENIVGVIGNDSEESILHAIPKTYVVRNASKKLKEQTSNLVKSNKLKGVESVIKKELC
ncbi:MAG: HAD family phosphatase [Bacilli bacterium]|nr:HAD family phosphatase [Bacilli bacterium]